MPPAGSTAPHLWGATIIGRIIAGELLFERMKRVAVLGVVVCMAPREVVAGHRRARASHGEHIGCFRRVRRAMSGLEGASCGKSQLPFGVPACARTKALPPLRLFLACVPRTSAPYLFGYAASSPAPQRLPLHPTPPPRCFPPHSALYCLPLHRPTSFHTRHSDARPTCCCPPLDQSSGKRGRAGHDGRAAVRALHFILLPVHRRRHSSRPR